MNPLIKRLTESAANFHGSTTYEACGHTHHCRCGHTEKRSVPGRCPTCEMKLRESEIRADKDTPLPIIVEQRPVNYYVCPHCKQEIYEKHTYIDEGVERHAECKGAIKWPPTDWSKIDPQWRKLLGGPK